MREVRCGGVSRWNAALAVALALLVSAALGPPARAVMRYGPLQISGNLDQLNLVRDSNPEKFQFIMNRNILRLRVDWDWLKKGRLIDRFDLPFIESSNVFLLYRGVYDSFYDIAPTDLQEGQGRSDDLIGGPIAGNTPGQCVGGTCPQGPTNGVFKPLLPGSYSRWSDADRTGRSFENRLREAYIDFKIKIQDQPLKFRLGRQQIIWGESDTFRVMDCFNPLDFTWHADWESWDDIRIPMWVGKGLWDIGTLGPLSNTFLEVVYNPFDFQDGLKVDFNPRPWSVPYPYPLRGGQVQNAGAFFVSPRFNLQGTSLSKGNFQRNPQDASEIGTRFHGVTPQGFEFSLNYLYGRARGLGGASTNGFEIEKINIPYSLTQLKPGVAIGYYQDPSMPAAKPIYPVDVTGKIIHPYMHIFGMTGNYFEGDYTQSVLRFETAYVLGEPYQTIDPASLVNVTAGGQRLSAYPCSDPRGNCGSEGFTKRDIWTGMVGFDRPTWIRFLNSKATWFLTGQFFWTYTTGNVNQLVGSASTGDAPYYGPTGQWKSGPYAGLVERTQWSSCPGVGANQGCGNGDNIRRWEHLVTLAASSYYKSGTVVPFIANAWDPVNDNDLISWSVSYYYTNNFIITLEQNFFTTYGSKAPSNDPEYTGGRFDRRDETGIRLTYQF